CRRTNGCQSFEYCLLRPPWPRRCGASITGSPSVRSFNEVWHEPGIRRPGRGHMMVATKEVRAMRIRAQVTVAVALLGAVGLLAGCGEAAAKSAAWHASPTAGSSAAPSPSASTAGTSISAPADGATNVPTSVELTLTGAGAGAAVTLTDAAGA